VDERTDEDLLVAVAAGPGALPEFYRRHVAKVIGFGVRRFGDPEEVADFVASVFLQVLESAGGFDPRRGRAVSWLYGVATHVAAGQRRRQQQVLDLHTRLKGRRLLGPDDYERIDEQIDAARRVRALHAAVAALPPSEREVIELVAVDGLTPQEVAAALGLRPITARVRLARARRRLRDVLHQAESGPRTSGAAIPVSPHPHALPEEASA